MRLLHPTVAVFVFGSALSAGLAVSAPKPAPTIKDLEIRQIEVKKDGPTGANADIDTAMERVPA